MSRFFFALSVLAAWFIVGLSCALADTAPATTVAVLPVYQAAEPYLLSAFGILFSALLGWALTLLQRRTGIVVDAAERAKVQEAATNAAGRILADFEGNVSTAKFNVGSPGIAAEIRAVQLAIPDALAHFGITPDAIAKLIVGKIGLAQTSAASAPPVLKIGT